jgi:hypothetical protein
MCKPVLRSHWKSPFILLVDRGGCSFVQKVRNAQHAGAAAVVIADNMCQCKHDKVCTMDPADMDDLTPTCEEKEPIMADDGSGNDITIPSVLIFKQDADPIKSAIKKHTVRIELAWSLPNPDDHVEWELWTSPTDYVSKEFKTEFKSAIAALGDSATFTPHMYIYDGLAAGCRNDEGKSECFNLCTNEGRYCAADPDNDLDYGISGADVVTESLRRLCIWELYGGDGVGQPYWDYVEDFVNNCDTSELFMKEICVQESMMAATVDFDQVQECIDEMGGLEVPEGNEMLENELTEKETKGIVVMPVVYVNGVPIRGELEFATVFKALCAGYKSGTAPKICDKCAKCSDEKTCVVSGGKCPAQAGTVNTSTFAGSLLGLALIFTIIGGALYMKQKQQMEDQVKGMIKEYMPLDVNNAQVVDTSLDVDDDDARGTFT